MGRKYGIIKIKIGFSVKLYEEKSKIDLNGQSLESRKCGDAHLFELNGLLLKWTNQKIG